MAKCVIKTGKHGFSDDLGLLEIFAIKSSEKNSSFSNNCCSLRNEIIFRLLLVKLLKLINILSTTLLIFRWPVIALFGVCLEEKIFTTMGLFRSLNWNVGKLLSTDSLKFTKRLPPFSVHWDPTDVFSFLEDILWRLNYIYRGASFRLGLLAGFNRKWHCITGKHPKIRQVLTTKYYNLMSAPLLCPKTSSPFLVLQPTSCNWWNFGVSTRTSRVLFLHKPNDRYASKYCLVELYCGKKINTGHNS